VSTSSTINLEFSEMPAEFNQDQQFIQTVASSAAKARSGVRAKWTELPNCMNWCNFIDETTLKPTDPPADGQPAGLYIPLRDDLANAIIATCKGAEPTAGAEACPVNEPEVFDTAVPATVPNPAT
jgi:hypothetical protein